MKTNYQKLIDFVNPDKLKDSLIVCSLYISFFETLKDYIIEQPRSFYSIGFSTEAGEKISTSYNEKVLANNPNSVLKASLSWFKNYNAINQDDIEIFFSLREYRNKLTHNMLQILYDGLDDSFTDKFSRLIELKIKLERWWVFNIEIPTDDLENIEEIKEDDVITSSQILYRLILDVLSEDENKANYYYSEFLKKINEDKQ